MKFNKFFSIFVVLLFSAAAVAQDWTSVSLSGNASDGYYINMPRTGTNELTLTAESPTTFKVYDDGGKNGNYGNNCIGYLAITVPEGKVIHLTGTAITERRYDYFKIHNGKSADASTWEDVAYSDSKGVEVDFISNSNAITLHFVSDESSNKLGLDFALSVEPVTNLNLGSINGLLLGYEYNNGNAISIEYAVANAMGQTLTKDGDYTAAITDNNGNEVTSVTDEGKYTLTISGAGEYTGTLTSTFFVGSIDLSILTENYTASDGDELTCITSYTVYIADGATVTLNSATITGGIVCNGSATIILAGENNVNASQADDDSAAGIRIGGENTTLIIKGEGSLTVEGKYEDAGIGAKYCTSGGSIEIQSGTINAKGGAGIGAAGIGGGGSSSIQSIIISGGTITATGGNDAAGIGSGYGFTTSTCGDITISGATIVATGGYGAPGIGAAMGDAECGNISITGGTITAIGGEESSGLGSGYAYYNSKANCGNITITEGITRLTVTRGADCENAIGAGNDGSTCGTITIGGVETGAISVGTFVTFPYTVAYDANGGTGTMQSTTMMAGLTKQLAECSFTRTNRVFVGWNTESQGSGTAYADKAEVKDLTTTAGATVTLYAQWGHSITAQADPYSPGTYYTTFYDSTTSYVADCEVYYVTANADGKITLSNAAGNIVKAGEGVILKATKETVTLSPTNTSASYDSRLTGSDTETTVENALVLSLGENGVRFYKYSGTMGAHKAYLPAQ